MLRFLFIVFLLCGVFLYFGNDWLIRIENDSPSALVYQDNREIVLNAKRLLASGPNFESYSRALSTLGRTHVHSRLRPVIMDSYKFLEQSAPKVQWIYGETGWQNGGDFWPHRTHRNGLSVDFITPVLDKNNQPAKMSLWPWNAFGYRIRFDFDGTHQSLRIDFAAIIKHLNALQKACANHGLSIRRVIFDPPLLKLLKSQPDFSTISAIPFMDGAAWFPHDSHYHVDFELID